MCIPGATKGDRCGKKGRRGRCVYKRSSKPDPFNGDFPFRYLFCERSVAAYQQCGGFDYSGPTQCKRGLRCKEVNVWFSRCVPK